jgi:small-conductance mechanosensitive channel
MAASTPDAAATPTPLLGEIVMTRIPEPTATPGAVAREVEKMAARAGLAWTRVLGLTIAEWTTLATSLLAVLFAYLLGTLLIRRVLPPLVRRTASDLDDRLLAKAGSQLRWLVVIITLELVMQPWTFLDADAKQVLGDVYFVLALTIGVNLTWTAINLIADGYWERAKRANREKELAPVITLLSRLARVVWAVSAVSVLLTHFGINVTALLAAVGIGGLAISLAARDTIADAIAGLIILIDQPFRVGDRIEVEAVGTWEEVTDIGLRTTRIRTWRNREVIVPNARIGENQVVNYSYPDPQYLVVVLVTVAYGTDVEMARQIIVDTVRQVEGVVLDKPVRARYGAMGDSSMIFSAEWSVESIADERPVVDRVNTALQQALDAAGIKMPYPTQNVNLQVEPETVSRLSEAFREPRST